MSSASLTSCKSSIEAPVTSALNVNVTKVVLPLKTWAGLRSIVAFQNRPCVPLYWFCTPGPGE